MKLRSLYEIFVAYVNDTSALQFTPRKHPDEEIFDQGKYSEKNDNNSMYGSCVCCSAITYRPSVIISARTI